jgi:hypothetical protein
MKKVQSASVPSMKMVLNLTGLYIDEIIQLDSLVKAGVLKAAQFKREKGNGPLNRSRDWAQLRMPGEFHQ